jgi:cobyrinic acid a,c-diamide synthase
VRLGIAQDAAFHFYYPDNLEVLAQRGVQWVPFSPLHDRQLPLALDGLYLGGGYPETHAARLSDNVALLEEIRQFAASGRVVYAECGGLMYLGRAITLLDGSRHLLAGVLPVETAMLDRFAELGYAEMTWTADGLWGRAGQKLRGHEFHYSRILGADALGDGWLAAGLVSRRRVQPTPAGYCRGRILASYVHLHWASRPEAMNQFLTHCEGRP